MSQKLDDLAAVKIIYETLEPFDEVERERILRWASEKIGIKNFPPASRSSGSHQTTPVLPAKDSQPYGAKDIKTFLTEKNPKSETQLVAAVAYYYKFEAPISERKNGINKDDLMDACRKASTVRPKFPNQVLVNASRYGLVDKIGPGTYEINAVGENLVAVSMPGAGSTAPKKKRANSKPGKSKSKKK